MSTKKHKLSMAIEEDFCLLGISSDEPDYKLCWLINNAGGFSFTRTDDIVLFSKKLDMDQSFSLFHYENEGKMLYYRLIGNRAENGFFLSDLKNIDYLLHIQGDVFTEEMDALLSKLNSISAIRMCVPVDLSRIKEMDRLLLW